jgi:hypothetical protein
VPAKWAINGQLIILLAVALPLTVWTKFIPTGDMRFDEQTFQLKTYDFLKQHQAQLGDRPIKYVAFQRIEFSFQSCDSAVVVLSASDAWAGMLTKRTPSGHIVKFRYKDYLGDVQPNYRATFTEFYEILMHPRSQENRRQPILALIATPTCMQTIQDIPWDKYWNV